MGMSASQSNLLYYTSRLHDVENAAQFIESEKLALAVRSDEIYQTYCNAMDAKKIQVAFNDDAGKRYFVDASFNNVCTYDPTRVKQYSLADSKSGKIFVNSETKKAYDTFKDDKYSFAWEMIGLQGSINELWGNNNKELSEVEQAIVERHLMQNNTTNGINADTDLTEAFDEYKKLCRLQTYGVNGDEISDDQIIDALNNVKDKLYDKYMSEIYPLMRLNKNYSSGCIQQVLNYVDSETSISDALDNLLNNTNATKISVSGDEEFPQEEFKYYLNLWQSIHNAGGCKEIPTDAQMGDESNQWFNNMVNSGRAIINVYNENKKEWGETTVGTSSNVNFLQENQDETDLKKAEAEYEYQLSIIEAKDANFDKELSKLETERSSIKNIMESLTKVIDDNVERTFNIFS